MDDTHHPLTEALRSMAPEVLSRLSHALTMALNDAIQEGKPLSDLPQSNRRREKIDGLAYLAEHVSCALAVNASLT